jgi:large subunit ribosomal protein L23
MKNPHEIIIKPHITEKSVAQSYGDERGALKRLQNEAKLEARTAKGKKAAEPVKITEDDVVRKYTFIVAQGANKIEIKQALESIYNTGRKPDQAIKITEVRTINLPRKLKRRGRGAAGFSPVRRKAIITLAKGQMLEDYGV